MEITPWHGRSMGSTKTGILVNSTVKRSIVRVGSAVPIQYIAQTVMYETTLQNMTFFN